MNKNPKKINKRMKEDKGLKKKKTGDAKINVNPKKYKLQSKGKDSVDSEESEDDAECLYCGYFYSQSNEGWVSCTVCHKWAHCSCAGEEDEDDEVHHVCEFCKQDW